MNDFEKFLKQHSIPVGAEQALFYGFVDVDRFRGIVSGEVLPTEEEAMCIHDRTHNLVAMESFGGFDNGKVDYDKGRDQQAEEAKEEIPAAQLRPRRGRPRRAKS